MKPLLQNASKKGRAAVIGLIRVYQRTLSPDHGVVSANPYRGCRFYPSCSEYTARAIEKNGVLKGGAQGAWRVMRCNPFTEGGVDDLK